MSSAEDMALWMKWNLNQIVSLDGNMSHFRDAYRSHVSPRSMDGIMHRPVFPVADSPQGYGYGWFISTYRGRRITLRKITRASPKKIGKGRVMYD